MLPSLEAGKEGPLAKWAANCGTDWPTYAREAPGISTFTLEDGVVYHTYADPPGRPVSGPAGVYLQ